MELGLCFGNLSIKRCLVTSGIYTHINRVLVASMLCVFDMVLFQNFLLKRLSNTFNFFCVCPPLTKATTTTGSIKIKNQTLCGKKGKNNVKIIKEIKWELLFKSFASYLNPFDKTCPPPPFFTLKNI